MSEEKLTETVTATAQATAEVDSAAAGEEGFAQPPKSKKKLVLIALIVVIALVGIGSFVFFRKHQESDEKEKETAEAEAKNLSAFNDLDEMIVNLNTEGKTVSFMKLKITLELEGKDNIDTVNKMMPRIKDVFQVYLRELRPIDVQGSVGLYRLREELLLRVNKVIFPAKVKDILFREVLVQ
ncbi:MAG: flagellar basal body-associated FliL family protein [Alphaproteobacteria bacterium]|jgi:flagellar FliL protein|nr:flagellar basal body-associated FliL family protein [Candidatus Jidaibacter sp.]